MKLQPYGVLMAVAVVISLVFWVRLARRNDRLLVIYIAALLGAFLGAKIVYLAAEGCMHIGAPDQWLQFATGKSILGALLGGYLAVELAKRFVGYPAATGDWFATIVPLVVIAGRAGCLLHGCCLGTPCASAWYTLNDDQGQARWPAVPAEMVFNAVALALFWAMRRKRILPDQHFHVYLVGYGIFRLGHEFLRDTPRIAHDFSGYQAAALAVLALGACGFIARQRNRAALAEQALA
jgi:phosphatidylglycerol:prolipoprotein diacylglycerol transferase